MGGPQRRPHPAAEYDEPIAHAPATDPPANQIATGDTVPTATLPVARVDAIAELNRSLRRYTALASPPRWMRDSPHGISLGRLVSQLENADHRGHTERFDELRVTVADEMRRLALLERWQTANGSLLASYVRDRCRLLESTLPARERSPRWSGRSFLAWTACCARLSDAIRDAVDLDALAPGELVFAIDRLNNALRYMQRAAAAQEAEQLN
jgi:hypothetical protein